MRRPRPAGAATARPAAVALAGAGLAAALLLGACQPAARQATDGGVVPPAANAENAAQSTVQTESGPLGPADRALLVRVRQTALWEIPVGREAARRAARAQTRRNLGRIAARDPRLDDLARRFAARLNVPLPNEPSADQQSWMSEITGKSGTDYDKTAVARLRTAQGMLYQSAAAVRASTRNRLMRDFAQRAQRFVEGNMKLVEGTGFVTGDTLPDPPPVTDAPPPAVPGAARSPAPAATSLLPRGGNREGGG